MILATKRPQRNKKTNRRSLRTRPRFENLELRRMMAGDLGSELVEETTPAIESTIEAIVGETEQIGSGMGATAEAVDAAFAVPPEIADTVWALKSDVEDDGQVDLAEYPLFSNLGLDWMSIDNAVVSLDGTLEGKVSFGNGEVNSLIQYTGDDWVVAVKLPEAPMSDWLPAVEGTVIDEINMHSPIVAFSTQTSTEQSLLFDAGDEDPITMDSDEMSDVARDFYGQVYESEDFEVRLHRGLNLLTSVSLEEGSSLESAFGILNVGVNEVALEGILLKNFDTDDLKEAHSEGRLGDALIDGMALRATLPNFELENLPSGFATGDAFFEVTGQPSAAVGFDLEVPQSDGTTRDFEAKLRIKKEDTGTTELAIAAVTEGRWENAFDVDGLHLDRAAMILTIDSMNNIGFGLSGDMQIGTKYVSLGGKLEVNAMTGVVTNVALKGSLDSLNRDDVVAFASGVTDVANDLGFEFTTLDANSMPDFELRNLEITFAPLGGDEVLQIDDGLGLEGELYVDGDLVGFLDGSVDTLGAEPTISIQAWADELRLGALRLDNPEVDIYIGPGDNDRFIIRGTAELGLSTTVVDVNMLPTRMYFHVTQTVNGLYEAEFEYSSPTGDNPVWSFTAVVQAGMSDEVEGALSDTINQIGQDVLADLAVAQRGLDIAQAEVNKLNGELATARAEAQAEFDAVQRDLAAAQSAVNSAQSFVSRSYRSYRSAYSAWRSAVSKTNSVPWYSKPYYKAVEAGKYSTYVARYATYRGAQASLSVANSALSVVQAAAGWALSSPEVHPNVIRINAELAVANGVLSVARGALNIAEDAAGLAANYDTSAFMVDRVSFKGVLVDYAAAMASGQYHLLNDTQFEFLVDYRWMGENEQFRLYASTEQIGPQMLIDALTDVLPIDF